MIISLLKAKHKKEEEKEVINIHKLASAIVGTIIGLKSGLFGIGGGAISVPYLNSFGLPMKKATGTSSAFTLPISIVGTICFICIGMFNHSNIPYSIGYVHWAASVIIIPFTMYFAHIGCLISNRMPTKWLRAAFILFLLFVSCKMLI